MLIGEALDSSRIEITEFQGSTKRRKRVSQTIRNAVDWRNGTPIANLWLAAHIREALACVGSDIYHIRERETGQQNRSDNLNSADSG